MIEIKETHDFLLLADLNKDLHQYHCALEPKVFKPYERETMLKWFEQLMAEETTYAYVAYREDQTLGFVLAMLKTEEENNFKYANRYLYLDQIWVNENVRQAGVGRQLVQKVSDLARDLGIEEIQVDHWSRNQTAAAFFSDWGFSYIKQRMRIHLT